MLFSVPEIHSLICRELPTGCFQSSKWRRECSGATGTRQAGAQRGPAAQDVSSIAHCIALFVYIWSAQRTLQLPQLFA